MIIDLDALGHKRLPLPQHTRATAWRRRGGLFKFRYFLIIWAALSGLWVAGAGYNIYQRIDEQADMSVDVEHDLDEGLSPASCVGRCLTAIADNPMANRLDIASTYFKFGSLEMSECVLGPPAALLLVGLGAFSVLRRRRFR